MRTKLLAVACVAVIFVMTGQVQAGTIVKFGTHSGNEKYVHQILDLDIGGTLYDVTFNEGSFDDVYGPPVGASSLFAATPFSYSEASAATSVIVNYLNSNIPSTAISGFTGDVIAETGSFSYFFVPPQQALSATSILVGFPYGYVYSIAGISYTDDNPYDWSRGDADVRAFNHWATFEASRVVPEPTSFAIWGLGCLGLVGMRLRRKLV